MSKMKWDEDTIKRRILQLVETGEELTCTRVKEIDSKLVGAAISFYGNWGKAIEAAGLDYAKIRAASKKTRMKAVQIWSREKVLEEIRKTAGAEEDISYAFMKEKYSSLVAAACNYIGSWKKALEEAGFNYDEVQKKGRENRKILQKEWHRELLLKRLEKMGTADSASIKEKHPRFHKLLMSHFKSWVKVVEQMEKRRKIEDK